MYNRPVISFSFCDNLTMPSKAMAKFTCSAFILLYRLLRPVFCSTKRCCCARCSFLHFAQGLQRLLFILCQAHQKNDVCCKHRCKHLFMTLVANYSIGFFKITNKNKLIAPCCFLLLFYCYTISVRCLFDYVLAKFIAIFFFM